MYDTTLKFSLVCSGFVSLVLSNVLVYSVLCCLMTLVEQLRVGEGALFFHFKKMKKKDRKEVPRGTFVD